MDENTYRNQKEIEDVFRAVQEAAEEGYSTDFRTKIVVSSMLADISKSLASIADSLERRRYDKS